MSNVSQMLMSQLPPEFDDFQPSDYDPQYTADISTHMHVPEHIDVSGADESLSSLHFDDRLNSHLSQMTVPDKIIILGAINKISLDSRPIYWLAR